MLDFLEVLVLLALLVLLVVTDPGNTEPHKAYNSFRGIDPRNGVSGKRHFFCSVFVLFSAVTPGIQMLQMLTSIFNSPGERCAAAALVRFFVI